MRTSEFDYELPRKLIAQTPIEPRDASRLLVVDRADQRIEHRRFSDLVNLLCPGDLLVANESRVIPARLFGRKVPTGGAVEMLLLNQCSPQTWEVLLKPGRRVKPGARLAIESAPGSSERTNTGRVPVDGVFAEVIGTTEAGGRVLEFNVPIKPMLKELGIVPLPPYIHTPLQDPERYQTIYSRTTGSVAAPTAGLHFTDRLLAGLAERGIHLAFVTLHVSMDTFRPVQETNVEEHHMHSEYCQLPVETSVAINRARLEGRRVIAVGTTSVRVLETAGMRLQAGEKELQAFSGPTDLFVRPGHKFRVVQAMITNFHLPRSTLLVLVAAFTGKDVLDRAYEEAIRERYRFYSFGDAMLIV